LVSSCLTQVESQQDFAAQYHIQTDLGADRFFRFQTHSGQYRKEILRPDGSQEGTYGWVDPNGVLRLFDYIADNFGYRIVKESLFKVGAASPGSVVATRGGDIELGFEVYPLDGAPQGALPASRLHLTEGSLGATPGYSVASLTSTSHHLDPNPLTKHEGATFFSGEPLPPPPPRPIVVGAESASLPPVPEVRDNIVVGHTGDTRPAQVPEARTAPARGNGIVIGLSNHGGASVTRQISRQVPSPAAPRRNSIVIGSTRRRRSLIWLA
jgi:hypothetical protein